MKHVTQELERIEKEIASLGKRNESLQTLLDAFGPLLLVEERMRCALLTAGLMAVDADAEAFTRGVPIMVDRPLGDYADAFLAAARKIFPVMAGTFPGIFDELGQVLYHLERGTLDPAPLMEARIAGDEAAVVTIAQTLELDPQVLTLASGYALRPILRVCGREAGEALGQHNWDRGYCPVCGGLPHVAMLRSSGQDDPYLKSHGGQRWLSCSRCTTQWRFKRHACPHCGNEENDTLKYYSPQDDAAQRADLCTSCGRYLVTLDVRELTNEPTPDLAALGLLHLDVHMQDKGFAPVAETAWNNLG